MYVICLTAEMLSKTFSDPSRILVKCAKWQCFQLFLKPTVNVSCAWYFSYSTDCWWWSDEEEPAALLIYSAEPLALEEKGDEKGGACWENNTPISCVLLQLRAGVFHEQACRGLTWTCQEPSRIWGPHRPGATRATTTRTRQRWRAGRSINTKEISSKWALIEESKWTCISADLLHKQLQILNWTLCFSVQNAWYL